jgi:hypothetical protein
VRSSLWLRSVFACLFAFLLVCLFVYLFVCSISRLGTLKKCISSTQLFIQTVLLNHFGLIN